MQMLAHHHHKQQEFLPSSRLRYESTKSQFKAVDRYIMGFTHEQASQYITSFPFIYEIYKKNQPNDQWKLLNQLMKVPSQSDEPGFIYGFMDEKQNSLLEAPYWIKMGRTKQNPPQARIFQWQRDDNAAITQIFTVRSLYNKKLESLVHTLFAYARKDRVINGKRRIQWFHFNQITLTAAAVNILNHIMNCIHTKKLDSSRKQYLNRDLKQLTQKIHQTNIQIKEISEKQPKSVIQNFVRDLGIQLGKNQRVKLQLKNSNNLNQALYTIKQLTIGKQANEFINNLNNFQIVVELLKDQINKYKQHLFKTITQLYDKTRVNYYNENKQKVNQGSKLLHEMNEKQKFDSSIRNNQQKSMKLKTGRSKSRSPFSKIRQKQIDKPDGNTCKVNKTTSPISHKNIKNQETCNLSKSDRKIEIRQNQTSLKLQSKQPPTVNQLLKKQNEQTQIGSDNNFQYSNNVKQSRKQLMEYKSHLVQKCESKTYNNNNAQSHNLVQQEHRSKRIKTQNQVQARATKQYPEFSKIKQESVKVVVYNAQGQHSRIQKLQVSQIQKSNDVLKKYKVKQKVSQDISFIDDNSILNQTKTQQQLQQQTMSLSSKQHMLLEFQTARLSQLLAQNLHDPILKAKHGYIIYAQNFIFDVEHLKLNFIVLLFAKKISITKQCKISKTQKNISQASNESFRGFLKCYCYEVENEQLVYADRGCGKYFAFYQVDINNNKIKALDKHHKKTQIQQSDYKIADKLYKIFPFS